MDGTACQMTRDCKGQFVHCSVEEVAWYRAGIALIKHGKPCCNICIQPWQSWNIKRGPKVANFMKYNKCEGCTVTQHIAVVPEAAAAAAAATAAAAAAAAAAPAPHQLQVTHPPPPPPPQPQNLNQAFAILRNMEAKVAVLEAEAQDLRRRVPTLENDAQIHLMRIMTLEGTLNLRTVALEDKLNMMQVEHGTMIQAMTQRMDELQLKMNERMDAQQPRMDERMEPQHLRSPDSEDGAADDLFVDVTSEQATLQWYRNGPQSPPEDNQRQPHDLGRMMR